MVLPPQPSALALHCLQRFRNKPMFFEGGRGSTCRRRPPLWHCREPPAPLPALSHNAARISFRATRTRSPFFHIHAQGIPRQPLSKQQQRNSSAASQSSLAPFILCLDLCFTLCFLGAARAHPAPPQGPCHSPPLSLSLTRESRESARGAGTAPWTGRELGVAPPPTHPPALIPFFLFPRAQGLSKRDDESSLMTTTMMMMLIMIT